MNPMNQPAEAGNGARETAHPCIMTIFGATGDLTKRKLIPALYNLARQGLLPDDFAIVGFASGDLTVERFRNQVTEDLRKFATEAVTEDLLQWFAQRIYYVSGRFDDADAYRRLAEILVSLTGSATQPRNHVYYLAVAPNYFGVIAEYLSEAKLLEESPASPRRHVVIEKPFGRNLESAQALNRTLLRVLAERQIYRIDHYLGKETVQNLLVFRFGNGIFEPVWNRHYIDHVQITAAETVGVEQRGRYYDTAGALRDMIPNHLFQLISLTAMEPPNSFQADAVRDEQAKVLAALPALSPEDVLARTVRGQYDASRSGEHAMPGYRAETHVAADSATETFVAMKVTLDNWRWAGVPFYLRTGKRLASRRTEIAIQFKRAPFALFRETAVGALTDNRLVIRIQPDEGISLRIGAKTPGALMRQGPVELDFSYRDHFGGQTATGYERLLYDCMEGEQTLFQRADMVEAGWAAIGPIQDVWSALVPRSFPNYSAGSMGPAEADALLSRDGRAWLQ
jgi:glucose-6-phosphate 1-dehydrogenase